MAEYSSHVMSVTANDSRLEAILNKYRVFLRYSIKVDVFGRVRCFDVKHFAVPHLSQSNVIRDSYSADPTVNADRVAQLWA